MTKPTYPVPETHEQEAALEKALATRTLQKIEAAKAIFSGREYRAFRAELEDLLALKLPASSATNQNASNLVRFLDTMQRGVEQDHAAANALVNPPSVPEPPAPPVPA